MQGKIETPVLFGDVFRNDVAELLDLVGYFHRAGKNENATFLYGVAQRYEIICSAYQTAIDRERGKKAEKFDSLQANAAEILAVLKEIAGDGSIVRLRQELHEKARTVIAKAEGRIVD